ncbi:hypothetical protein LXL04_007809 [Taraxacum kok-saghyz]
MFWRGFYCGSGYEVTKWSRNAECRSADQNHIINLVFCYGVSLATKRNNRQKGKELLTLEEYSTHEREWSWEITTCKGVQRDAMLGQIREKKLMKMVMDTFSKKELEAGREEGACLDREGNSYIPENPRTPKPLTFSKNRLRGIKNRSNTSPVANSFFFSKKTTFFSKNLHISLYNTYLKSFFKKIEKKNAKKKLHIYKKKVNIYAKLEKKNIVFSEFFFQRIIMITLLQNSSTTPLPPPTHRSIRLRTPAPANSSSPPAAAISPSPLAHYLLLVRNFFLFASRLSKNLDDCSLFNCLSAHDRTAPTTISPRSFSSTVLELGFGSLCRRSKLKGLGFSICTEIDEFELKSTGN